MTYTSVYSAETNDFTVEVEPSYIADQSLPEQNQYVFAYTVRIKNNGRTKAQLMRRHWIIQNGQQKKEEVEGEGVIGQQPVFEPGFVFEYTSFCPLNTPTGSMRGSYLFQKDNGETFRIQIPLFFLRDHAHNH